jgi:hypothetical protein
MGTPSDEAAADAARDAGDRHRTAGAAQPKLWACEPARWKWKRNGRDGVQPFVSPEEWENRAGITSSWWWAQPAEVLFSTPWPRCGTCGHLVTWVGPPTRRDGLWVYRVSCPCPAGDETCTWSDEIESDFPLQMGGTAAFWKTLGVLCNE